MAVLASSALELGGVDYCRLLLYILYMLLESAPPIQPGMDPLRQGSRFSEQLRLGGPWVLSASSTFKNLVAIIGVAF